MKHFTIEKNGPYEDGFGWFRVQGVNVVADFWFFDAAASVCGSGDSVYPAGAIAEKTARDLVTAIGGVA